VGGTVVSRSIAGGLGIDLQRADRLKKSSQINLMNKGDRTALLIYPVVGMILDEIKRLREIYHKKSPLKKIEKIIFTGGTSKMNSLIKYFAGELSLDCQLGNSLARIGAEKKYEKVVEEVAPELAVAIGLALRGLGGK
jgi:Tfp pilus assembly PilM family ATPase